MDSHHEQRRGTRDQARDYCRKVETRVEGPYEFGEWMVTGHGGEKRTRDQELLEGIAAIQNGQSIADLDSLIVAKHYKSL